MKTWIHIYITVIIFMVVVVWGSVSRKIIPEITYAETILSGMIIVLLVYLPVLTKMAEDK